MARHPEYADSTFAMFHQGEPVSLISRLERDLVVFGHPLRMGFIGGVCTHPEHRGKGLATAILEACMNRFHANGVDFVYISGARGLYYATGANHVGGRTGFRLRSDTLAGTLSLSSPPCEGRERGV
jgi:predicted GNAT family acetyltransferase